VPYSIWVELRGVDDNDTRAQYPLITAHLLNYVANRRAKPKNTDLVRMREGVSQPIANRHRVP
jgi:hypothetical protein